MNLILCSCFETKRALRSLKRALLSVKKSPTFWIWSSCLVVKPKDFLSCMAFAVMFDTGESVPLPGTCCQPSNLELTSLSSLSRSVLHLLCSLSLSFALFCSLLLSLALFCSLLLSSAFSCSLFLSCCLVLLLSRSRYRKQERERESKRT